MIHVGFFILVAVLSTVYIVLCELTFPRTQRLWYRGDTDA